MSGHRGLIDTGCSPQTLSSEIHHYLGYVSCQVCVMLSNMAVTNSVVTVLLESNNIK